MSDPIRAELAEVLAAHEARWTTHGDVRLYDVIHCAGDCDWSLRQKASMFNDRCHEAHRAHVADLLAEYVATKQGEAWTLGHAKGRDYQGDGWNCDAHDPEDDNPYREAP